MAGGGVTISGTLAMLIPPSIALVLYGLVAQGSIGKLLIAGVIPGLRGTAPSSRTGVARGGREPACAPPGRSYPWRAQFGSLGVVGPMLMLFMLVTGVS